MRPTGTEIDEFLLRLRDAEPEKRASITRIRNYIAPSPVERALKNNATLHKDTRL